MKRYYRDMTLKEIVDLATESSPEMAAIGNRLMDYETGYAMPCIDEETALFLASARNLVLELARRLQGAGDDAGH